jgi:hypothetical protein
MKYGKFLLLACCLPAALLASRAVVARSAFPARLEVDYARVCQKLPR